MERATRTARKIEGSDSICVFKHQCVPCVHDVRGLLCQDMHLLDDLLTRVYTSAISLLQLCYL